MGWWWSFAVIDKPSAVQRYPPGSFISIHCLAVGGWFEDIELVSSSMQGLLNFTLKKSIFAFIYWGLAPGPPCCLLRLAHSAIPEYRVRSENRRCLRQDEDISITTVARCYSYCLYE